MDIDLITVAMPLRNVLRAIDTRDMAVSGQLRVIRTKTHRAAKIAARFTLLDALFAHPFGDNTNNWFGGGAKFGAGCTGDTRGVARAFNARHLHAEANAKERHFALTCEFDRRNLAF